MVALVIGSFVIIAVGIGVIGTYDDDKELKASIFLISLGFAGLIASTILSIFF